MRAWQLDVSESEGGTKAWRELPRLMRRAAPSCQLKHKPEVVCPGLWKSFERFKSRPAATAAATPTHPRLPSCQLTCCARGGLSGQELGYKEAGDIGTIGHRSHALLAAHYQSPRRATDEGRTTITMGRLIAAATQSPVIAAITTRPT